MRIFLTKATLFFGIQLIIAIFLINNYRQRQRLGYMAAFDDKIQLLKNHKSPSIIFLGGSSVAFGVDSEQIHQAIGLPVINAGLHSALGLELYLAMAEKYARPGDVVVLQPEWALLTGQFKARGPQFQTFLREWPSAWAMSNHRLAPNDFFDKYALQEIAFAIQAGLRYQTPKTKQQQQMLAAIPGRYSRLNFNRHGDFVGHHGLNSLLPIHKLPFKLKFNDHQLKPAVDRINSLAKSIEGKGAKLYFSFPPLPKSHVAKNPQFIASGYEYLQQHLSTPILQSPTNSTHDDQFFFDRVYHLNQTGKTIQTERLLQSLQPLLQRPLSGIVAQRHQALTDSDLK